MRDSLPVRSPAAAGGKKAATVPAFITLRNVDKFFGDFQALDNVSLDIGLGQKIVICGPSGSGKSTLIRCINRLETHDRGEIAIDGVTLDDGAAAKSVLRNNVGMVFQQFNLFPHLSILDNLTLGPVRARGLEPSWLMHKHTLYRSASASRTSAKAGMAASGTASDAALATAARRDMPAALILRASPEATRRAAATSL